MKRIRSLFVLGLMAWTTASFAQAGAVTHYMVTGVVASGQDDLNLFSAGYGQKFTARLDIAHAALPAPTYTQDGNSSWYSWVLSSPGPQQGNIYYWDANGDRRGNIKLAGPQGLPLTVGVNDGSPDAGGPMIWANEWDASTIYLSNDVVSRNGGAWLAREASLGSDPETA